MIHCDECKYWDDEEFFKIRSCSSEKWLKGYDVGEDEIEDDEVIVENDAGWAFETGPKFGCIHGEKK